MQKEQFASRLQAALQEKNIKQIELVRLAEEKGFKLGKSHISQYVSGKTLPRKEILAFLADTLGVDANWLAGEKENTEKEAENTMRTFKKSSKLDNVLYDVRGPVVDEANRMEASGLRVLKLNIGNPAPFGFQAPDEVIHDMRQQLTECEGYSDSRGLFAARKAIMQYAQIKHIPNVTMDDIYTGNGASELIQLSLHALLNSGDEVLVPSPDYPLWTACVNLAGGKAVHYICDESSDWCPDIEDIKRKITPMTKALVIINPNNPTGALYPKELLEQLVQIAREHQICVVTVLHDLNLAIRYCDRFLFLKDARVFACGGPEVMSPQNIEAVYDMHVHINSEVVNRGYLLGKMEESGIWGGGLISACPEESGDALLALPYRERVKNLLKMEIVNKKFLTYLVILNWRLENWEFQYCYFHN